MVPLLAQKFPLLQSQHLRALNLFTLVQVEWHTMVAVAPKSFVTYNMQIFQRR